MSLGNYFPVLLFKDHSNDTVQENDRYREILGLVTCCCEVTVLLLKYLFNLLYSMTDFVIAPLGNTNKLRIFQGGTLRRAIK